MKNYVKEYKGHDVPEGSMKVGINLNGSFAFYEKTDKNPCMFCNVNKVWQEQPCHDQWNAAIELPEAKQEWMPEVGDRIVICFDDVDIDDLNENEIAINGMEVTFIGSLVSGVGQTIFAYDDNDNFSDCYPSEYFRPLKTQQEKERESVVCNALEVLGYDSTEFDISNNIEGSHEVFDTLLGLYKKGALIVPDAAPKAGDNE